MSDSASLPPHRPPEWYTARGRFKRKVYEDLESGRLFREYSRAKDDMLAFSDIPVPDV